MAIFVFDAYGTLFDVHAAIARFRAEAGPDADRMSEIWRTKQLEYTWTLTLAGHYVDFWTLTERALDYSLAYRGRACEPPHHLTYPPPLGRCAPRVIDSGASKPKSGTTCWSRCARGPIPGPVSSGSSPRFYLSSNEHCWPATTSCYSRVVARPKC